MYRGHLKRDLQEWTRKGLIDEATAGRLLADVDARRSAFSVGTVLVMLAAVLIAASVLLLVASNWEAIPRLTKVIGIVALIWIFHLVALFARSRDADRLAAACLVLGAASFGGAISLIGQLYHLSGDTFSAMLLWFVVTAGSAALFRSGALTVMAGILSFVVFWTVIIDRFDYDFRWHELASYWPPAAAAVLAALTIWTRTDPAKHFAYLLLLCWCVWFYVLGDDLLWATLMTGVGSVVFFAFALPASPLSRLRTKLGASVTFYPLLLAFIGLAYWHGNAVNGQTMVILGVLIIALCLAALALEGRDNGAVRFLAYIVFAFEVLYLSYETIDSILGTSAFFLLAGLVVAVLAFLVIRLEKHFGRRSTEVQP
ncbi:DUF2157 domain-containing protein [Rhizobium sp. 18065]|uniref:DUF2157 domain-containing protein n=1 Tax=Rhizobium sp. 18065 TaxID=2681411 RepID=UPI00135C131E|nr:DUF2157 domain-containing protein [Rhizobium sp. 18065]